MNEPLKARAARGVIIGLVLMTVFAFFFVYPGHDPEPNGLPVAVVVGEGDAELAGALAQRGFDVRPARDEAHVRRLIADREVYGGLASGQPAIVSSAASFVVAQILREVGEGEAVDARPVDKDDPRGAAINLTLLPLMITSILAAMILGQMTPDMGTRTRFELAMFMAIAGGLIVMGIVNQGIGALPGNYLAVSGIAALGILAVFLPAGALIRLLGPPGVGVGFMIFLMLGVPASGSATAPELLPTPWAEGGPFLQAGALGTALRNTAYFDGAALALPVIVLLVWALVGVGLHLLADRRSPARA